MIKNIINRGIGFNPGSIKYIITGGLSSGDQEDQNRSGNRVETLRRLSKRLLKVLRK